MSGKLLLLIILMLNFVAIMINGACNSSDPDVSCAGLAQENTILNRFYNWNSNADLYGSGTISASSNYTKAAEDLTTPTSGVTGGSSVFTVFIDSVKMLLALVGLLTPLPAFLLIATLNMPLWISMFLGIILGIMYLIGIAEFLGGRKF
jgi:hypothetical protein